MWHYNGWGGARWMDLNDNDRAVHALMVTWFHWGIHGWIPYTVVGALVGILSYRRGMPMTMRFTLYPLIGEQVCFIAPVAAAHARLRSRWRPSTKSPTHPST